MPQVFKIGQYWVYFWSNEGKPQEPVHIHVLKGNPNPKSTKIWITSAGKCMLSNNDSKISENHLRNIMRVIEARYQDVIQSWIDLFGEIHYYC